jgi:hypothetical protein
MSAKRFHEQQATTNTNNQQQTITHSKNFELATKRCLCMQAGGEARAKLPGRYKTRGSSRAQAAEEAAQQEQQTQEERADTEGEAVVLSDPGGLPLGDDANTVARSRRSSVASEADYSIGQDEWDHLGGDEGLEQAFPQSSPPSPAYNPGTSPFIRASLSAKAKETEHPQGFAESKRQRPTDNRRSQSHCHYRQPLQGLSNQEQRTQSVVRALWNI